MIAPAALDTGGALAATETGTGFDEVLEGLSGAMQPVVAAPTRTGILRVLLLERVTLSAGAISIMNCQLQRNRPSTVLNCSAVTAGTASHGADLQVDERQDQHPASCIASHACRSPRLWKSSNASLNASSDSSGRS